MSAEEASHEEWLAAVEAGLIDEPPPTDPRDINQNLTVVRDRTSWWPRNLSDVVEGKEKQPPTSLQRTDGRSLFYRGKLNMVFGASGDGKTTLVAAGVSQHLDRGEVVVVIDFESAEEDWVHLLRGLGVGDDVLRGPGRRFFYIRPDEPLYTNKGVPTSGCLDLQEFLEAIEPAMIVVDGVTDGMELHGLNPNDNAEVSRFRRWVLTPLERTGAAVVPIDHVTKNAETRGGWAIGAQAKKAMITGASFEVKMSKPFARGHDGILMVTCRKDKGGGFWKRNEDVAEAHVQTDATHVIAVELRPPVACGAGDPDWQPTWYKESVSDYLERNPGEHTKTDVRAGVGKTAKWVDLALNSLVADGLVGHRRDGNANRYRHLKPYQQSMDLSADLSESDHPTT